MEFWEILASVLKVYSMCFIRSFSDELAFRNHFLKSNLQVNTSCFIKEKRIHNLRELPYISFGLFVDYGSSLHSVKSHFISKVRVVQMSSIRFFENSTFLWFVHVDELLLSKHSKCISQLNCALHSYDYF